MIGFYEAFPLNVHKVEVFTTSISSKRLQEQLIKIFYQLNKKTFNLEDVAVPSVPYCTVIFELGIAEKNSFNYLDEDEVEKTLKFIRRKPLQIIDFFCALRYYKKVQDEERKPLKFDYYMLRFMFSKGSVEMLVVHERGPRYVAPEEIASFLANKINETFSRKVLRVTETT
jgi:hypothetical protein